MAETRGKFDRDFRMVRVSGPAYAGCGPFGAEPGLAARPEGLRGRCPVTEKPALGFAGLLRELRVEARLTQEELAEAARLSPRTVSDLERGVNRTAHKDTAGLLADALGLAGPVRRLVRGGGPGPGAGGAGTGRRPEAPAALAAAVTGGSPSPAVAPVPVPRELPADVSGIHRPGDRAGRAGPAAARPPDQPGAAGRGRW